MQVLCQRADLETHPTYGVAVDGELYIVLHHEGQVIAYINSCPHLSIPLEWLEHEFLDSDTGLIRCSTHGALFLPSDGTCVSGPCAGEALQSVAITEVDGTIYLV
ncbi:MAG TPA: Rieske (2Fe-2S) protein [Marinagarivorans sp.]